MSHQILIAGGAGFIGSRLAIRLAEERPQHKVVALDNLSRRGSHLRLPALAAAGVRFVHGDTREASDLSANSLVSQTVIDCAADPSVLAGYRQPRKMIDNNLIGTANLLEATRRWQGRYVFFSTSRVYPIGPLSGLSFERTADRFELNDSTPPAGISGRGVAESMELSGHRSIYGASKLAAELLVEEYHHGFDMPTVVNRCGVVAGPGQMGRVEQGIFGLWVSAHVLKRPLQYIGYGGQGLQVRDLLHVDDLIDLILLQLESFHRVDGQTFNVGGGHERSLSLKETTDLCREITGTRLMIQANEKTRPGDIPWFVTDTTQVESTLPWQPRRSAAETLQATARWITDQREEIAASLK